MSFLFGEEPSTSTTNPRDLILPEESDERGARNQLYNYFFGDDQNSVYEQNGRYYRRGTGTTQWTPQTKSFGGGDGNGDTRTVWVNSETGQVSYNRPADLNADAEISGDEYNRVRNNRGVLQTAADNQSRTLQQVTDFANNQNSADRQFNQDYNINRMNQHSANMDQYRDQTNSLGQLMMNNALSTANTVTAANNSLNDYKQGLRATQDHFISKMEGQGDKYNSLIQNTANAGNTYIGQAQSLMDESNRVSNATRAGYDSLMQGNLPSSYQTNSEAAIQGGLERTLGRLINQNNQSGVLDSTTTQAGLADMSRTTADQLSQDFRDNINLQANLLGQSNQTGMGNVQTKAGLANQLFGNTVQSQTTQGNLIGAQGQEERANHALNADLLGQGANIANQQVNNSLQLGNNLNNMGNSIGGMINQGANIANQQANITNQQINNNRQTGNDQFGRLGTILGYNNDQVNQATNFYNNAANRRYNLRGETVVNPGSPGLLGSWASGGFKGLKL